MSKRGRGANANGRSKFGEPFVALPYSLIRSPAFRDLSGAAVRVLLELKARYRPDRNGDLSLSLDEGARLLGVGKATIKRALAELVEHGFITMATRGRWLGRKAATYALTDKPVAGNPPTNEWKMWTKNNFEVLSRTTKRPSGPFQNHETAESASSGPFQNPSGPKKAVSRSIPEPPLEICHTGETCRTQPNVIVMPAQVVSNG